MSRISSHTRDLNDVLHAGLAKNHWGSPAASLRILNIFCAPILFSSLAPLLLSSHEISVILTHMRKTLRQLQRLHPTTPMPAVHLLSGMLPAEASLHLHQFTLLHMLASLGPDHPLHCIVTHNLPILLKLCGFSNCGK